MDRKCRLIRCRDGVSRIFFFVWVIRRDWCKVEDVGVVEGCEVGVDDVFDMWRM